MSLIVQASTRLDGEVKPSSEIGRLAPYSRTVDETVQHLGHRAILWWGRILTGSSAAASVEEASPLARPELAPSAIDTRLTEEGLAQALVDLKRAHAEQVNVATDPDAEELRTAEREYLRAQMIATQAQLDLERLAGPNPVMMEAAERAVQRAEATLRATMFASSAPRHIPSVVASPADTKSPGDSATRDAQLALQQAIALRDRLRAGPRADELDAARRAHAASQLLLAAAEERLQIARQRQRQVSTQASPASVPVDATQPH